MSGAEDVDVTAEAVLPENDAADPNVHTEDLGHGLFARIESLNDGQLEVRLYEDRADGLEPVYSAKHPNDFFEKGQTRKTIANDVREKVKNVNRSAAKEIVQDFFRSLMDAGEEVHDKFRDPEVSNLLEAAQDVTVWVGEPTKWTVQIKWDGRKRPLEFTAEEWTANSARAFKTKFNSVFFKTPEIGKDEWRELRTHWEEIVRVEGEETQSTAEVISDEVREYLATRIKATTERAHLGNSKEAAWFDIENSAGIGKVPAKEDVIWVQAGLIKDALDAVGQSVTYMSELGKTMSESGHTFDTSMAISFSREDGERQQKRCWPFSPEAVRKSKEFLEGSDEDEEDGDDAEDSTGDDDDDSGTDTDKSVLPDGGNVFPDDVDPADYPIYDDQPTEPYQEEVETTMSEQAVGRDMAQQTTGELMTDGGWVPANGCDSKTEVRRLYGAPGCGKTYTLMESLDREREENDRDSKDVIFCTFTRSGRMEAAEEIVEVFGVKEGETEDGVKGRAKTVHGTALGCAIEAGELDVPADAKMEDFILYDMEQDEYAYRDFCDAHALSFVAKRTNPLQMVRDDESFDAIGNRLFTIYHWLKLERRPLSDFARAPIGIPMDDVTTYNLLQAWEKFKLTNYEIPKYEHVDYVDVCIDEELTPEVRVLLIDEFQDLSPQEYLLYKTWRDSGVIDRIYIAGDTNQSIYSFRAGTPMYFDKTPVDYEQFVTDSWRCPKPVATIAREVLESCPHTDPHGFRAKFDEGAAHRINIEQPVTLGKAVLEALEAHESDELEDDDSVVYLLTRTNYQVGKIAQALIDAGIPFSELSSKMEPWDRLAVNALRVLRALANDEDVNGEALGHLLSMNVEGWKQRRSTLEFRSGQGHTKESYDPEIVWTVFNDCSTISDIASLIDCTDYQREMLLSAVMSDSPLLPSKVQVGTIHASKGSEAPCVFLFNAASKRIHDEMLTDTTAQAEEHRVSYVGATRASKTLYVVDGFFGTTYPLAGFNSVEVAA